MKKIVAVIDALNFREAQLDVFQYISRLLRGKLTIVFLENEAAPSMLVSDFAMGMPGSYYAAVSETAYNREKVLNENREKLKLACRQRDIWCILHQDKGIPLEEVVLESRFADLLLLPRTISFAFLYETDPPTFVTNVLARAECPVLILPETWTMPKEVIFTYNGTFSSMFAIRQFTQLFAPLTERKASVVYVAEKKQPEPPHQKLFEEYINFYYDDTEFKVLNGQPDAALLQLLKHRKDCIVTFGAYGRSALSRFFSPSNAANILRQVDVPIFITHP